MTLPRQAADELLPTPGPFSQVIQTGLLVGIGSVTLSLLASAPAFAQGLIGATADYELEATDFSAPIGSPGSFTVQSGGSPEVFVEPIPDNTWEADFGSNIVTLRQATTADDGIATTWSFTNFSSSNILSVTANSGTDPSTIASVTSNSIVFNTPVFSAAQSPIASFSYTILTGTPQAPVPAPIPALAAAGCFGWSRKLRARTKAARKSVTASAI